MRKQAVGCTQTLAKGKYTQMVAQHTICFYWLVPGPLIKHRVGDTFIPDKPISRQGFVLYNSGVNLACTPQL